MPSILGIMVEYVRCPRPKKIILRNERIIVRNALTFFRSSDPKVHSHSLSQETSWIHRIYLVVDKKLSKQSVQNTRMRETLNVAGVVL